MAGRIRWPMGVGVLVGLVLAGTAIFLSLRRLHPVIHPEVSVEWIFDSPQRGGIFSSPLVTEDALYVAALHDTAFRNAGTVYCLDRATGEPRWKFDDGGKMQHTFSSPCLADGRLYIGEGMHANFQCKFYCLDARSGEKLWDFLAEGHIESSPSVWEGKVYFGAGDDGIYCLDAVTGRRVWHFTGPYHIDSSPAVVEGRLYAGAGISRVKRHTEAWCLDARTGSVLWRYLANLPVWGSPTVAGDAVYFGLGNGRLLDGPEPPEKLAGGLICLGAKTGEMHWRRDVGDAVLGRAVVGAAHVYFGARDGRIRCVKRRTGHVCWEQDLGSPIIASPALNDGPGEEHLHVLASAGLVYCLAASDGEVRWVFDVASQSRLRPLLLSSPAVLEDATGNRRIYFGAELRTSVSSEAVMYCLRE